MRFLVGASWWALPTMAAGVGGESSGTYCSLLTTGHADCWGFGYDGDLGNGVYYTSGIYGSAVPVAVVGVGGVGTFSGLDSLASGAYSSCALLPAGGADCWGWSGHGYGWADPIALLG
jgi:hypothetical protein